MSERHTILDSITSAFVPIHREGHKFIAGFAVAALILFLLAPPLGWLGVIATVLCAYFFRDPERVTPQRPGLVVSAADGKIVNIGTVVPPKELALGEALLTRISVFLSVLDVHVVRAPVAGRVVHSVYVPGKFLNAELDKASEENERRAMVIETPAGEKIGVVLIAGLIARRIVTFVGEGASVAAGERIGLIRFGSRVDVYLPAGGDVLVAAGQTAIGGETALAELGAECSRRRALGWRRGFRSMFPPFDPERDDRKPRARVFSRGQVPTRVLIPNIFTLLGLCAGLTAIRMAIEHRWDLAVAALVFAAFLDGIDGRVARLLKAQSRFGAELDLLADFVNFGVAPAIIMFNWALDDLKSMGWIAVLIYAVCAALRLARFNVALDRTDLAGVEEQLFRGRAGAGRRHRAAVADLRAGSRPAFAGPHAARAALYARHRASDGEPRADFLRQADRPEDRTRARAAGVRARRAVHRLPADLSVADARRGLGHLSRAHPGQRLSLFPGRAADGAHCARAKRQGRFGADGDRAAVLPALDVRVAFARGQHAGDVVDQPAGGEQGA